MEKFQLYHDMQVRTNGEIYLGVVGPKFSKFLGIEHVDPLIFTLPGKQLLFDLDGQLDVSGVQF